jgi:hypothetical protein
MSLDKIPVAWSDEINGDRAPACKKAIISLTLKLPMSSPTSDISVLETIALEMATLDRLQGDLIRVSFKDHIDVNLEDIIKLQEPKAQLTGGRPYYLLVISPRYASVSKEAREFSATPEANEGALAKAVVTNSLGMRLVVNFFISINKPPVPHRVFTKEEDALAWIAELRAGQKHTPDLRDAN